MLHKQTLHAQRKKYDSHTFMNSMHWTEKFCLKIVFDSLEYVDFSVVNFQAGI